MRYKCRQGPAVPAAVLAAAPAAKTRIRCQQHPSGLLPLLRQRIEGSLLLGMLGMITC